MRGYSHFFFDSSRSFEGLLFPHSHNLCKNASVLGGTVLKGLCQEGIYVFESKLPFTALQENQEEDIK